MMFQSGHKISPYNDAELDRINREWEVTSTNTKRYVPGGWVLPESSSRFADKIYNYQFNKTDVVVMTYPKCGTTLTQEIVWTMINNANFDHPLADTFIMTRSPHLEYDIFLPKFEAAPPKGDPVINAFIKTCPGKDPNDGVTLQYLDTLPDPRVIKSHLPFSLLSPTILDSTKVVYVARNPKDVVVSLYHHVFSTKGYGYKESFESFVQTFVDDGALYGPYWLHLQEAWQKKAHPNLHIIFFEDLKKDVLGELERLNAFLNTNLSKEQLNKIAHYTSFSEMKARYQRLNFEDDLLGFFCREGGFFRKGEVGDWKCRLTPAMDAKMDDWIQKNLNFGVDFRYSS